MVSRSDGPFQTGDESVREKSSYEREGTSPPVVPGGVSGAPEEIDRGPHQETSIPSDSVTGNPGEEFPGPGGEVPGNPQEPPYWGIGGPYMSPYGVPPGGPYGPPDPAGMYAVPLPASGMYPPGQYGAGGGVNGGGVPVPPPMVPYPYPYPPYGGPYGVRYGNPYAVPYGASVLPEGPGPGNGGGSPEVPGESGYTGSGVPVPGTVRYPEGEVWAGAGAGTGNGTVPVLSPGSSVSTSSPIQSPRGTMSPGPVDPEETGARGTMDVKISRPRRGKAGRPVDEARKAQRREQILSAAIRMFAERGFAESRMQDLADQLGVAKGTIFHYFPTKEDLFFQTCRHYCFDRMFARLKEVGFLQATNPIQSLYTTIRAFIEYFRANPETVELLVLERAYFRDGVPDSYREAREEHYRGWLAGIHRMMESGWFREGIPAEWIFEIINYLVYGMVFLNHRETICAMTPHEQAASITRVL
ncbi:MAG: TetR/AcrR family transcriptional regulator, partial [Planctomycetia bacterium]|nr:TetR/AcrR family transcriptional regulator [Planctomycetia bacterium]